MIKDPNRIGDIAELRASVWLMEQGYEVFRNVGCTGKIDLIALRENELIKLDVKTISFNARPARVKELLRKKRDKNPTARLLLHCDGKFSWTLSQLALICGYDDREYM